MRIEHINCRCTSIPRPTMHDIVSRLTPSQRQFWEETCKAEARLLLSEMGLKALNRHNLIYIPTETECFGIHLLERDGNKP